MSITMEKTDTRTHGLAEQDLCHIAVGWATEALCGAPVPDEPPCCFGADPCGRPPCPDCARISDERAQ